jgi:hypothetical protein
MEMDGEVKYVFQPAGLNKEGQPVNRSYLSAARLEVTEGDYELVEVPFEILGTTVRDDASGFEGMAISLIQHINGCFHVEIQPPGLLEESKMPVKACEFDLRRCSGEAIKSLTESEYQQSVKRNPSPEEMPDRSFRFD